MGKRILPHSVITLALVLFTFIILDRYNPMMNFEFNNYSKIIIQICLVLTFLNAIYTLCLIRREKPKKQSWAGILWVLVDITIAAAIVLCIYLFMTKPEQLASQSDAVESRQLTTTSFPLPDTIPQAVLANGEIMPLEEYASDRVHIRLDRAQRSNGTDKNVFYIAQVYVTDATAIRTAFANGVYGKNIYQAPGKIAAANQAILAMNGDYYGGNDGGVVIRNGVSYRSDPAGSDVCVLFRDGTMKTYSSDTFDANTVIDQGAWQAWTFGPILLDGNGNKMSSYNTTSYIKDNTHPRSALGYVAPGHYVWIVEGGRQEDYSAGVTLDDLAEVLREQGCVSGYNLDGGRSSVMLWDGVIANHPDAGGRDLSDILYIEK